jgi:dipeptidyl aminopeptidase/acylaminoacyl peptidase
MRKFLALVQAAAFVMLPAGAQSASAPVDLPALRSLVRLSSPAFSPDSRRIAFIASKANFNGNRYDDALMIAAAAGGAPQTIVRAKGIGTPRWAPGGARIAYTAQDGKHMDQIFSVAPLPGAKPLQVTHSPTGVEEFSFSPDGGTIAYVAQNQAANVHAPHAKQQIFDISNDDYMAGAPPQPSHLWLIAANGGTARRLTNGSWSVFENAAPFSGGPSAPSWSADGKTIAFTRQDSAGDADTSRTRIATVDVASGEVHLETTHAAYEYTPQFAPRGRALAYMYLHGPGAVSDVDVYVTSPGSPVSRDISAPIDRNAAQLAWLSDASGIVVTADNHVGISMWVLPLHGRPRAIALGSLNPLEIDVARNGWIATIADNAQTAPELYVIARSGAAHRLTWLNAALDAYAYPRSEEISWSSPDGQRNDGILTYPIGYVTGKSYPLVVYSHGGPEAASSLTYDAGEIGPLRDLFAAHGYLVFEPNYRGSDNLGNAHEHAIYRDPGVGPDSDVMAGIATLEQRGLVDRARIAAVGHSYGGYMTGWLISHQHIWRCAVVADGALDWTQEYEYSGAGNMAWTRDSLGGSPWDPQSAKLYVSGSPLTYATHITTPTLILSGTADVTVPITESFSLFRTLQARHVPVEFIGIPGAHHSPSSPVQREAYYRAIAQWIEQRL